MVRRGSMHNMLAAPMDAAASGLAGLRADLTTWEEFRRNPFTYMAASIGALILFLAVGPAVMGSGISPFWKSEFLCWMSVIMSVSMLAGWALLMRPRRQRAPH